MIELKSAGDQSTPVETVVLFKIDDVEYRVPARPRVNLALQYLRDIRTEGAFLAEMLLTERLVGEEGYAALCNHDGLDPADLARVSDYAAKLALGALEAAELGNEGSGSKK